MNERELPQLVGVGLGGLELHHARRRGHTVAKGHRGCHHRVGKRRLHLGEVDARRHVAVAVGGHGLRGAGSRNGDLRTRRGVYAHDEDLTLHRRVRQVERECRAGSGGAAHGLGGRAARDRCVHRESARRRRLEPQPDAAAHLVGLVERHRERMGPRVEAVDIVGLSGRCQRGRREARRQRHREAVGRVPALGLEVDGCEELRVEVDRALGNGDATALEGAGDG